VDARPDSGLLVPKDRTRRSRSTKPWAAVRGVAHPVEALWQDAGVSDAQVECSTTAHSEEQQTATVAFCKSLSKR